MSEEKGFALFDRIGAYFRARGSKQSEPRVGALGMSDGARAFESGG